MTNPSHKLVPVEPTNRMVNAGVDQLLDSLGAGTVIDRDALFCYRAMLHAAPAVSPAPPLGATSEAVAVTPLEWDESRMNHGYPAFAESALGRYAIWEIDGSGYWKREEQHAGQRANGPGLSGAKAAAQADYAQRIRSALVAPPVSGLREALERAQEALNNAKVTGENPTSQRALEYHLEQCINLMRADDIASRIALKGDQHE